MNNAVFYGFYSTSIDENYTDKEDNENNAITCW